MTPRASLIIAALTCLAACGPELEPEGEPHEAIELGAFGGKAGYEELPEEGGAIEIVSGFQGGVHVEPGLRFDEGSFRRVELSGRVSLRVRRLSDGEVITEGASFPFEPYSFLVVEGGWIYHAPPVIFAGLSNSDTLVGERVRLEALVELTSAAWSRELVAEVELIDETDELSGGR